MPGRRITLTFRHQQDQTYRVDLRTADGRDYAGAFTLPYNAPTWAAIMQALEPGFDPTQAPEELREALAPLGDLGTLRVAVGNALGQALFADDALIEGMLGPLGNAASERTPLPVTLRFGHETDLLAALPWELLRHRDRFLVADGSLVLTRCPTSVEPPTLAHADLPLRVLLVLSEPLDAPPIFSHGARRELRHGLRTLDQEGAVIVDALGPPNFDTLVEAVTNGDYHLVVFYGHGAYDPGAGGLLLFEDPFGGQDPVPAAKVGAVLHNTSVRMALLSACQSGKISLPLTGEGPGMGSSLWSGTAPALLRVGVPLVVGMQTRLRIDAAQAFIRQFALSLAQAKPIAAAVGEARKPLLHGDGEQWFVPVLYGRPADSDRLFDPAAALPPETADLRARLRALRAKIADLEQTVSRVGTAYRPEELADLRAARRDFAETRAQLARKTPGGYTQVVSPLYGVPENRIFVGRSAEVRAVGQRLATGDPVVVWGTGGIGKTALAAEVARRQRWRFPGGVLWLDCRGGPALDTLLDRLGAFAGLAVEQIEPEKKPTAVRHALALLDDRYLVVFDNAEDVWDDPDVRDLIARLPDNGQVLLTTRRDPEQALWRTLELTRLEDAAMQQLFDRLAAAAGVKVGTRADLEAVPQIIDHLEGHPLALTLVVPLAHKRGLHRVWRDLQRRPLRGVAAAFAASYARLTALQRALFTRLSVFTIPFEWDAAYAVFPDAEEVAVDDALDVLVQRALVVFDGARYAYHTLVRQYAYERLQERGADPREVHRQAAAYLRERITDEERSGTPEEALEEVDQWERAQAWETFVRHASTLVGSLDRLGYWIEIEERLERAITVVREHLESHKLEGVLLNKLGVVADHQAKWKIGTEYYEQSLEIAQRINDLHLETTVWNNLANVYLHRGEWDRAIDIYKQSLEKLNQMNEDLAKAKILDNLGTAYARKGIWDQALNTHRHSLRIREEFEDIEGMAGTRGNLGSVYLHKGDWEQAILMYERSLEIYERLNNVKFIAQTSMNLGTAYLENGDSHRAIEMYQQSLDYFEHIKDPHGTAQALMNLGNVYLREDYLDKAIEVYLSSLVRFDELGDLPSLARTYHNLGIIYQQKGNWSHALKLLELSLELKERIDDPIGVAQTQAMKGLICLQNDRIDEAKSDLAHAYLTFDRADSSQKDRVAQILLIAFGGDVQSLNIFLSQVDEKIRMSK